MKSLQNQKLDPNVWIPYKALFQGLVACLDTKRSWKSRRETNKAVATLESYCKMGNINAVHLVLLLRAERMATKHHDLLEVQAAFDEAIRGAGREGVLSIQALANERVGVFFPNIAGNRDWASVYLSRARDLYKDWGATAKADQMPSFYGSEILEQSSLPKSTKPGLRSRSRVSNAMLNPSRKAQVLVVEGVTEDDAGKQKTS